MIERIVLDTDVLVAGLRSSRGASRRLLTALLNGRHKALASVPLMLQYEAVLTRPEHLSAAKVTVQDVEVLLDAVASIVEPVRIAYLWRPFLPDLGDDLVLETAVNGAADAIVTFNQRHFENARTYFGVEVLKPAEATERMESSRNEEE